MICEHCAWEADAVKAGVITHEKIKKANKNWRTGRIGHAACPGHQSCYCMHGEVYAWMTG